MTNEALTAEARKFAGVYCADTQSAMISTEKRMPKVRVLEALVVYFCFDEHDKDSSVGFPRTVPLPRKIEIGLERESGECFLARGSCASIGSVPFEALIVEARKLAKMFGSDTQPAIALETIPKVEVVDAVVVYFESEEHNEKFGVCLDRESGKVIYGRPFRGFEQKKSSP
jgi:hypothetical protein